MGLLLFLVGVNFLYGTFSFTLAQRSRGGHVPWLRVIALANMVWMPCCFGLAIWWWEEASVWGLLHLIAEGIFVGGLGLLEWRAAT